MFCITHVKIAATNCNEPKVNNAVIVYSKFLYSGRYPFIVFVNFSPNTKINLKSGVYRPSGLCTPCAQSGLEGQEADRKCMGRRPEVDEAWPEVE